MQSTAPQRRAGPSTLTDMKKGLFSVTFRSLGREKIAALAKEASLDEIIWGGDVHVPHGDFDAAKDALSVCRKQGVGTNIYGSYYKLADDGFSAVYDTSEALLSSVVRIWAGLKGSSDTTDDERDTIVRRLAIAADEAKKRSLTLAFEYHGGTLTDNAESALRLLDAVGRDNVRLHWQPNQYRDFDYNVRALTSVAPYVDAVHVFAWRGNDKLPLITQEREWRTYFDILAPHGNCALAALEFVPVETRDDLLRDAETLDMLLK